MPTPTDSDIRRIIERHQAALDRPNVLSVRSGWRITDHWLTGQRAIIVTVTDKRSVAPNEALPRELEGVAVDVRQASRRKRVALEGHLAAPVVDAPPDLGGLPSIALENLVAPSSPPELNPALAALVLEVARRPPLPRLGYTAPPGIALAPVSGPISVTAVASPEGGWSVLQRFLAGTEHSLTVGLHDFTSAHVLDAVTSSLSGKVLQLVLDHPARNPTTDQSDEDTVAALKEAFGSGLQQAWALDASDPFATAAIYPSAYHIKVAVRDHASVWLSSGNRNNSNQPAIDPVHNPSDAVEARRRDRDWHLVIDSPELARSSRPLSSTIWRSRAPTTPPSPVRRLST